MDLKSELAQFTGTENYYRHWLNRLVYTDGVKWLADTVGAHWFLDIVATEILPINKREPFISINLIVESSKADIKADDGNENPLFSQHIDYTDFPEGAWRFFLIDGILILPSEY